jgi:molybdopterin molybdotransferase
MSRPDAGWENPHRLKLTLASSRAAALPVESRPLSALHGAALAQDVVAERDQPPFDRVTMDGVAIASSTFSGGQRRYRIAGIQAAGASPLTLESDRECLEVMTGAILPRGCDAVVPFERVRIADGVAELPDLLAIEPYVNVHTRGLDCRSGERLLESGSRIGGPELMVIASAGSPRAQVEPSRASS